MDSPLSEKEREGSPSTRLVFITTSFWFPQTVYFESEITKELIFIPFGEKSLVNVNVKLVN